LFGISTDITLLELSDMAHPLHQRLAHEAPGTNHHSQMVANLAQAGVTAVGGNPLLANIASYFHDIGKLVKPEFFSENIQFSGNPHDDLSPSMSTLVIISHVKEGVSLGLQYRLPTPVVAAIQQHHGTGLVYYFFHKASARKDPEPHGLFKTNGQAPVSEEDFRYPGPKPQSKETAVIGMADAVEAASRSLEKVTPGHIEDIVNDIIAEKLRDGQFSDCPLTLAEINVIQKTFVFTLTTMLHSRISYPVHEYRSHQSPGAAAGERHATPEAPAALHG
ncbi:MAG: HDIG domain-containing protein, partial [Lentisphaerae bacterium]|nr:HDIG domain-containing protein [Lentisphaerota bacterium]